MKRITSTSIGAVALLLAACAEQTIPGDDPATGGNAATAAGANNGNPFDHPEPGEQPWEVIERLKKEGPPRVASRLHSCPKLRIAAIRQLLVSLGANMDSNNDGSAGQLLAQGQNALGAPIFANRVGENLAITTSSASRQFDIFASAAPEIIANLGNAPACQDGGQPVQLFDASNKCVESGVTCLIGVTASTETLVLCNQIIAQATTPDLGKRMAVAALLAAAHTCE